MSKNYDRNYDYLVVIMLNGKRFSSLIIVDCVDFLIEERSNTTNGFFISFLHFSIDNPLTNIMQCSLFCLNKSVSYTAYRMLHTTIVVVHIGSYYKHRKLQTPKITNIEKFSEFVIFGICKIGVCHFRNL